MIYLPMDEADDNQQITFTSYSTASMYPEPAFDPDALEAARKLVASYLKRSAELRAEYWFLIPPHQREFAQKIEFEPYDPFQWHSSFYFRSAQWIPDKQARYFLLNGAIYG